VFPTLAQQSADSQTQEERQTFLFGLRTILYLTIPAAVGLAVLGRPIVGLLLERGAFSSADATATAFALGWFAIGLPGHSVIEIVARVFYAERDTATPVKVAAAAVALNVGLSLLLMRTDLSFGGLALANSIAAITEATLLTALLNRRFHWIARGDLIGMLWRIGLASAVLAVVAMLIQGSLALVVDPTQWIGRIATIAVTTLLSGAMYVGVAHALGAQDVRQVVRLIRHR
jgi:putative peptidoglycan lipid II flippase